MNKVVSTALDISMIAVITTGLIAGIAINTGTPAMAKTTNTALAQIKSLDIEYFNNPVSNGTYVPPEIAQTITKELEHRNVLPYRSPSDAVLTLHCGGISCSSIQAQITLKSQGGLAGPVIWKGSRSIFTVPFVPYFKAKSIQIGKDLAQELLRDYQESLKLSSNTTPSTSSRKRIEP